MSNLEGNVEFSRLAYMIYVCGVLNEFERSILWFLCFVYCWYLMLDGPSSQHNTVHCNRERLTNQPLWLWCTATWSFMITMNSSCDHDVVLWHIFRRKKTIAIEWSWFLAKANRCLTVVKSVEPCIFYLCDWSVLGSWFECKFHGMN